jgi:prephenate dehydrogenase
VSETIAICGVGLIGGSLGLALRASGYAGEIIGVDREPSRLAEAAELGAIERGVTDAEAAAAAADIVVLAVPMGSMRALLSALAPGLGPDTAITDVGSVKASVVADARAVLGDIGGFVPGHPVAGTERTGVAAAMPELFRHRRVILTPTMETRADALARVEAMWRHTGAHTERLEVEAHDRLLAQTSHLPHMLAFGLVDALARSDDPAGVFRYAAGGFRDFTRIASSDPLMWRDVCLANREALLDALRAYREDLDALTQEVRARDGDGLLERFQRAKDARDRFCP